MLLTRRPGQTYWNGERHVHFAEVPFATARDGIPTWGSDIPSISATPHGMSSMDLSGTDFGVRVDGFMCRGCRPWGLLAVPLPPGHAGGPLGASHVRHHPVQQRLVLVGGGYVGRLTPSQDVTRNEVAEGFNNDHEGANGGWVLPVVPMREVSLEQHVDDTLRSHPGVTLPFVLAPHDEHGELVRGLQPVHHWQRVPPYDGEVRLSMFKVVAGSGEQ